LAAIGAFVTAAAEAAGLDDRAAYAVQMAVDEACSNIIEHGYVDDSAGEIACTYEISSEGLTVTLCDQGECFDPTRVSEPDLDAKLEDRTRGGLGIYFVRKLVDSVAYEYVPGCGNVLTLTKHKEIPS
jgi:serine/threonine-protein kinase RsbW